MSSSTENKLVIPIIHLNGSGKAGLMEQLIEAAEAGRAFEEALRKATPHGRDYYPLGDGVYLIAREQHIARLVKVGEIMKDLQEIALAIQDGGAKRE